jgi:hypothetical protein
MRITPPRAGDSMHHTHVNDIRQQTAGLYAAFIMLEVRTFAGELLVDRLVQVRD